MRKHSLPLLLLMLLLTSGSTIVPEYVISNDEVKMRAVVLMFGVDEALIKAGKRLENGGPGYEFGAKADCMLSVYGNPCLPEGSLNYAKYAMAHIVAMQRFILRDPYLRREYFKYFAVFYHAGSEVENNEYRRTLQACWLEERSILTSRKAYGGYSPLLYAPPGTDSPSTSTPKGGNVKP